MSIRTALDQQADAPGVARRRRQRRKLRLENVKRPKSRWIADGRGID
jgi:hypothetical protein